MKDWTRFSTGCCKQRLHSTKRNVISENQKSHSLVKQLGKTVSNQNQIECHAAVVNMEAPQNITELRRFLGMVNQLGKFLPNLATATELLRGLLSTGSSWYWGQPQRHAFNEIKRMLSSSPVLSLYDPNLPTKVIADSSSYGLGAILTQQQPDGIHK